MDGSCDDDENDDSDDDEKEDHYGYFKISMASSAGKAAYCFSK